MPGALPGVASFLFTEKWTIAAVREPWKRRLVTADENGTSTTDQAGPHFITEADMGIRVNLVGEIDQEIFAGDSVPGDLVD